MPRAKKPEQPSEDYKCYRKASNAMGETNDCSVMAVAIALGLPYEEVHARFKSFGRKNRDGTRSSITYAVLRSYRAKPIRTGLELFITRYPSPHRDVLKSVTSHHPARFAKHWPKGTFIFFNHTHMWCVKDGVTHDWSEGRALRAKTCWMINI